VCVSLGDFLNKFLLVCLFVAVIGTEREREKFNQQSGVYRVTREGANEAVSVDSKIKSM
jgi:hypothetical protein